LRDFFTIGGPVLRRRHPVQLCAARDFRAGSRGTRGPEFQPKQWHRGLLGKKDVPREFHQAPAHPPICGETIGTLAPANRVKSRIWAHLEMSGHLAKGLKQLFGARIRKCLNSGHFRLIPPKSPLNRPFQSLRPETALSLSREATITRARIDRSRSGRKLDVPPAQDVFLGSTRARVSFRAPSREPYGGSMPTHPRSSAVQPSKLLHQVLRQGFAPSSTIRSSDPYPRTALALALYRFSTRPPCLISPRL